MRRLRSVPRLAHEDDMRSRAVVALLTDFGTRDPFVGIMKGVILGICPEAALVDLCHEVPTHDVLGASLLLHTAAAAFPAGTIHVAVVDPGVGGPRRAILAEVDGRLFVAPDNGLLSFPLAAGGPRRVRHLTVQEYWRHPVSATFHGRDVFAPVAGHLAAGVEPSRFGPEIDDPVLLEIPRPRRSGSRSLHGEVIWVDRFGNCMTNVTQGDLAQLDPTRAADIRIRVAGGVVGKLVEYFGELAPGESGAVVGSAGRVELFCNRGNLASQWGLSAGDPVTLEAGTE